MHSRRGWGTGHKLALQWSLCNMFLFNPLSAMGDFKHHIMVNLSYVEVKERTYGLISWVKCSSERFTMEKSVF